MLQGWGCGEWIKPDGPQPHEATLLRLDCSKARAELGWRPAYPTIREGLEPFSLSRISGTSDFDGASTSSTQPGVTRR